MAAATLPKSAGSKRKSTSAKTASTRGRLTAATKRTKQITAAAVTTGEIVGSGAAASALAGWRGSKGTKLGPVDARLVAGLGAMVAGMWNPATTNQHFVNVGIGVLGSWVHEQAFEMGAKWGGDTGGTSVSSEGVVVGAVDDDDDDDDDATGALRPRRRARRLARLSRKIQRLKARRARVVGRGGGGRRALGGGGGYGGGAPQMVTVPAYAVRPQYRRQFA